MFAPVYNGHGQRDELPLKLTTFSYFRDTIQKFGKFRLNKLFYFLRWREGQSKLPKWMGGHSRNFNPKPVQRNLRFSSHKMASWSELIERLMVTSTLFLVASGYTQTSNKPKR